MQLTSAHITILGGDVRYSYCAQQLRQAGWQVDTFQVQGSPDTMALPGLFQPQRDYLLPYPAFNARGYIPFLQGETILHCSDLIQGPITGSRFLCGRPGAFAQQLQNAGAQVLDYEKDEFLTTANAIPTAEGALALAMQQMPDTLWESRCLVLGFGRVGKQLSLRLQRLGARVTVAVRKDADRALLEALRERGIPAGVVSSKKGSTLRGVLEHLDVVRLLCSVTGGDQVARPKPDPEGILAAVAALNLTPDQVLYCGDTILDAQAAQRSGAHFCAVLNGTTPASAFAPYPCDHIAPDLMDLKNLLGL